MLTWVTANIAVVSQTIDLHLCLTIVYIVKRVDYTFVHNMSGIKTDDFGSAQLLCCI